MFSARWIPGVAVDRAELRTTLAYQFTPRFSAGIEYNPLANDIGPIANFLAVPEEGDYPALILGTSSDRIGTTHGRAVYATLSKDLEAWTELPAAPYVGLSYGTFDDELEVIGGLYIRWTEDFSSTHSWDGHNLHHLLELSVNERMTAGVVVVDIDGAYDVGVTLSIGF
jgi:hypothetical protein